MKDVNDWLDTVSLVLWRCFFIGTIFLLFWAAMFMRAGGLMYQQCAMFGLTSHECSVLHYGAMALFKFLVLIFFLFPYVSIRLVLRKRRTKGN